MPSFTSLCLKFGELKPYWTVSLQTIHPVSDGPGKLITPLQPHLGKLATLSGTTMDRLRPVNIHRTPDKAVYNAAWDSQPAIAKCYSTSRIMRSVKTTESQPALKADHNAVMQRRPAPMRERGFIKGVQMVLNSFHLFLPMDQCVPRYSLQD